MIGVLIQSDHGTKGLGQPTKIALILRTFTLEDGLESLQERD